MGRHAAAVVVDVLPDARAHAVAAVAVALVVGGAVGQQGQQRRQQAGRAHFLYKVLLAVIVYGQLRRRRGAHHLDAAGPGMPEIAVHRLIPLFGDQRQVLRPAGGVVAHVPGAQPARRQRHIQLYAELVVDRQHAAHIALRGDADLQLAGRFQRDAVLRRGIPHIQPVDGDGRILRVLHLAQDALHLGKGDGFPAHMGQEVLCLQPQGQRPLRLAAAAEIVDQGLFLFVQLGHTGAPVRGRGQWRPPHCLLTFLQL